MPTHFDRPQTRLRVILAGLFAGALGLCLPGCSGSSTPADPSIARDSLKTTLESWKSGATTESLKSGSPSIVAQDLDWMGGMQLVNYEVAGEGEGRDVNIRIPVKLTLKNKQGKELKKAVTYIVGTSPVITVFRAFP